MSVNPPTDPVVARLLGRIKDIEEACKKGVADIQEEIAAIRKHCPHQEEPFLVGDSYGTITGIRCKACGALKTPEGWA